MPRTLRLGLMLGLPLAAGLAVALLVLREPHTPAEVAKVATAVGPASIPQFELPDVAGHVHSITEWRGKVVVLNFWATWCAPCRREMPLLDVLHRESIADLRVVGVAVDHAEPVQQFLADSGVRYPILVGQDEAMQIAQRIAPDFEGLPLSVVVGPALEILQVHLGELHPQQIKAIATTAKALGQGRVSIDEARKQLTRAFQRP
jgi:thiol-disulfide isomerase/thioredoxin